MNEKNETPKKMNEKSTAFFKTFSEKNFSHKTIDPSIAKKKAARNSKENTRLKKEKNTSSKNRIGNNKMARGILFLRLLSLLLGRSGI